MRINLFEKQIKQCVQQWVCMQVWAPSELFSLIYCRKLSENRFPQNLPTLLKNFSPVVQTKRNKLGFVTPIELPGDAVRAFHGELGRR